MQIVSPYLSPRHNSKSSTGVLSLLCTTGCSLQRLRPLQNRACGKDDQLLPKYLQEESQRTMLSGCDSLKIRGKLIIQNNHTATKSFSYLHHCQCVSHTSLKTTLTRSGIFSSLNEIPLFPLDCGSGDPFPSGRSPALHP